MKIYIHVPYKVHVDKVRFVSSVNIGIQLKAFCARLFLIEGDPEIAKSVYLSSIIRDFIYSFDFVGDP